MAINLRTPIREELFNAFISRGHKIMFVGGVVRDLLRGIPLEEIADIDLATTALPEESMEICAQAGFKTLPTGIKHGTITAMKERESFEITTLRKDIQTDGRHAKVSYTDRFEQDAERRDFTINAMYMDLDGQVLDFYKGKIDLEELRLQFVGDADLRIQEDYLRILRYFRFMAKLGKEVQIDAETLAAIKRYAPYLEQLSAERITEEMFKILSQRDAVTALEAMKEQEVLEALQLELDAEALEQAQTFELEHSKKPISALDALIASAWHIANASQVVDNPYLKLSNKQKDFIKETFKARQDIHAPEPEKATYLFGKDVTELVLKLKAAINGDKRAEMALEQIKDFEVPKFPLSGKDAKEMGIDAGPEMGARLKAAEKWWIDNDFPPKEIVASVLEQDKELSLSELEKQRFPEKDLSKEAPEISLEIER